MGRSTLSNYTNTLRACVLPTFKDMDIKTINRKAIQDFLTKQAKKYSKSYLKSMTVTLCMTLAWAEQNGYLQQPNGWLEGIRLPKGNARSESLAHGAIAETNLGLCGATAGAVVVAGAAVGSSRAAR